MIAIYSAIYGNKNKILEVPEIDGVSNIMYTDYDIISKYYKGWEIRKSKGEEFNSSVLNAKQFKLLPHKFLAEYDTTIWVDGSIKTKNIVEFIELYNKNEMVVFDHNHTTFDKRDCIYDEAKVVMSQGLDKKSTINKQIGEYKSEGFPKNNGLICGGVLLRKNTDLINKIMDEWWSEIIKGSFRDQLSFNYVAWKNDFKPHYIKDDIRSNKYFKINE
jgi:hypothetical protein